MFLHFQIYKNGYISSSPNHTLDRIFKQSAGFAMYATEFWLGNYGKIYYREISSTAEMELLNKEIYNFTKDTFTTSIAVVITYVDVDTVTDIDSKHTFQLVLLSNDNVTYSVLHYTKLDNTGAFNGFYES